MSARIITVLIKVIGWRYTPCFVSLTRTDATPMPAHFFPSRKNRGWAVKAATNLPGSRLRLSPMLYRGILI